MMSYAGAAQAESGIRVRGVVAVQPILQHRGVDQAWWTFVNTVSQHPETTHLEHIKTPPHLDKDGAVRTNYKRVWGR